MPTSITYLGHAAFAVQTGGKTILIDPFLTGNPLAQATADDVAADFIIITHGHADHVGDTAAIAARTGATVIANFEIVTWLQEQGVENAHPMHIGGSHQFEFGTVKLTVAHHGSMLPDGSNGGSPTGVIIGTSDGNIYHAGDTGLFSDMKLIGEEGLKVAILPIGDNFTMGPQDSVKAAQFLGPEVVIPCHFNTWPLIEQDTGQWSSAVTSETSSTPVVLSPGDSHSL
jgi:L-ascorbate metabolism protein UlaG (beta-lactamase superfamily)